MIGGANGQSLNPHHVEIRNCKVHDLLGAGIALHVADYVTIDNNTVYNNAWYSMYATSGITTIYPFNYDSNTGYRIIIRRNTCYFNKTMVQWADRPGWADYSDGNGIIVDVDNRQDGAAIYTGRTLDENNVNYMNGGIGINSLANHVDVVNNSIDKNGQATTSYPNVLTGWCSDVKVLNNTMYAKSDGKCNENTSTTNVTYDYNNISI